MPTYEYHLANGKTLVLEGDQEPTDQDVEEAAQQAGVRTLLMNPKESAPTKEPGFTEGLTGQASTHITLGDLLDKGPGVFKQMATPQYAGEVTRDAAALAAGKYGPRAVGGSLRSAGKFLQAEPQEIGTIGGFVGGAAIGHPWLGLASGRVLGRPIAATGRGLESLGNRISPQSSPLGSGAKPPPQQSDMDMSNLPKPGWNLSEPAQASPTQTPAPSHAPSQPGMTVNDSVGRLRAVAKDVAGPQYQEAAFRNLIAKVGLAEALRQYGID